MGFSISAGKITVVGNPEESAKTKAQPRGGSMKPATAGVNLHRGSAPLKKGGAAAPPRPRRKAQMGQSPGRPKNPLKKSVARCLPMTLGRGRVHDPREKQR